MGTIPARGAKYSMSIPKGTISIILDNNLFDDDRIIGLAKKVGIPQRDASSILFDKQGNRQIKSKKAQVFVNSEGALNINMGTPNFENTRAIDEKKATDIARWIISDLGMDKGIELKQGNTRQKFTCGASSKGSEQVGKTEIIETIIQFRQQFNGVESVNSDHGLITVSVDNDGKVTNVYNSTKGISGITKKPISTVEPPPEKVKSTDVAKEKQFEHKIKRIVNGSIGGNGTKMSGKVNILSDKAGYDFSGNVGTIVHQRDVEIDLDEKFAKRYKLRVPYFD
jgi:hypothetical protein